MNDFCFLSVAFGPRYVEQQMRLHKSIQDIHPDAQHFAWTDTLPPGSKPHTESLYGFKVHAVNHALSLGYKKIIWLDPACIVMKPVDYYFTLGLPVIAARDDNKLSNHIGSKALMWYSKTSIPDSWHLVGGSLYVFDFNRPDCQKIFNTWERAEVNGIFGSQQEQATGKINKHRNDESCMAMSLYLNGYEPLPCDEARYCYGPETIIDKKHFK
jgi:hypothetical protein